MTSLIGTVWIRVPPSVRRLIKQILRRDLFFYRQVRCRKDLIGRGCAGYVVCPDEITSGSIVFSCGIGEDISFDQAMIGRFGVTVHGFDPTPRSVSWIQKQEVPANFKFHPFGIADYDGTAKFHPHEDPLHVSHTMLRRESTADRAVEVKVYRLKTLMAMLDCPRIDVLKMDIEGAEYGVIRDLLACELDVRQLVLEFHHHLPTVNLRTTRDAILALNRGGFKIFFVSPDGQTYSFIKPRKP